MDYVADIAKDENEGQFISTKSYATLSGNQTGSEGKTNVRDKVTPKNISSRLATEILDITLKPESRSTRTNLDGDSDSMTSRQLTNLTVLSDGEGRLCSGHHQVGLVNVGSVPSTAAIGNPDINRNKNNEQTSKNQTKDCSNSVVRGSYDKKHLNRVLKQEERDSGIVTQNGRISLRPQEDSGMGWDSRFSSSTSARDSGLGTKSKSYDDLYGKFVAAAVEMSNTRGSEASLTDRIADIMERESPQRQVTS